MSIWTINNKLMPSRRNICCIYKCVTFGIPSTFSTFLNDLRIINRHINSLHIRNRITFALIINYSFPSFHLIDDIQLIPVFLISFIIRHVYKLVVIQHSSDSFLNCFSLFGTIHYVGTLASG